jgi:NADH-quinone oxidoreductase subunit A
LPPSHHASFEEAKPVDDLLREYLPIVIFLGLAVGLGLALMLAAWILAVRNPDPEKISAYECGFNAFDDARMKFDVRFYLVSILFIIFDLEIAFLFPWAAAFGELSDTAFWSMMVFLAVLTVGFAYEWKKGALEWE